MSLSQFQRVVDVGHTDPPVVAGSASGTASSAGLTQTVPKMYPSKKLRKVTSAKELCSHHIESADTKTLHIKESASKSGHMLSYHFAQISIRNGMKNV